MADADLVKIIDTDFLEPRRPGEVVMISSKRVAEFFDKQHFHALRDIAHLRSQVPDFFRSNFESKKIKLLSGKEEISEVLMTREGFFMLSMGYNTEKAMKLKVAILARFTVLEKYYFQREGYTKAAQAKLNRAMVSEMLHAGYSKDIIYREIMPTRAQKQEAEIADLCTLFEVDGVVL